MLMKGFLFFLKFWGKDEKELNEVILNLVMFFYVFIILLWLCEVCLIMVFFIVISFKVYL